MSVPVVAVYSGRGGLGDTSLVYHLSWMFADRGLRVVAADLDPQSNLTAWFLDEDRLEQLQAVAGEPKTVFGAVQPLIRGAGDVADPHVEIIAERLGLIPGDLGLSAFEDSLSEAWPNCAAGDERSFRVASAFSSVVQKAGAAQESDLVLVDLGANPGAIHRAALIAADFVVVPLGPDVFSLQALTILGPALRRLRAQWRERLAKNPNADLRLPADAVKPIGYILLRRTVRLDRPVKSFAKWIARMPSTYARELLQQEPDPAVTVGVDPNCLAGLKNYRLIMPMAEEARKPMFFLRPGDGATGAYMYAVTESYKDFKRVAVKIAENAGLRELT